MIGTRRITRRSFLAAAGLAAVGASLSLTGCSGSVSDGLSSKHLLVAHSHSEAHPVNVGLQKMAEVASAESDLTFSVYPNGQLGDNAAMIQLVKAGVLDIAKVSASSMEQFNSAYAIFSMPYVFESTEQYFAVMNQSEAVQEIFKSTYDQGFFAIGWFDSGSRSIYTTKDGPCEGPADLKGLKIRTQDSPTSIAMIRAMGGSATPMSSGETYTGLQQGIIDGAENNETVLVQDGHGEVCKSYTYFQQHIVHRPCVDGKALNFRELCKRFPDALLHVDKQAVDVPFQMTVHPPDAIRKTVHFLGAENAVLHPSDNVPPAGRTNVDGKIIFVHNAPPVWPCLLPV